jgi:RHS repeat-associated protein
LYGNIFREALYAQDIRGLKQYELTDHLGNVLATVSDKRSAGETTGLLTGADSILTFRPVLASTYDYYPFGSLMPGRYMEDTNSYCFTTTETKYVVVPFLEIATPTSGPSALISPGAGTPPTVTDVPGGGIDIDFDPVDAGTMASVSFASGIDAPANTQVETNIEVSVLDAVFNISVIDDSTGNVLASRQVASMQGNTNLLKIIIPNPAASTRIRVKLDQPGQNINRIRINVVRSTSYITTTVNVVSTVCNKAQYPFGFNGQMKVDEVAGKGNHLDFGARMYDSRIARFISVDPLMKKYPMWSPYSGFANNPIRFVDRDGAEPGDVVVAFGGGDWQMIGDKGIAPNIIQSINSAYIQKYGGKAQAFASQFWNVSPKSAADLNKATQSAYEFIKANYNKQDGKDVEGGKIIIEGYSMGVA